MNQISIERATSGRTTGDVVIAAATRAGGSAPKTGLEAGDPKNGNKNYRVRKTAV